MRMRSRPFSVRSAAAGDAEALAALCAQAQHPVSAEEVATRLALIAQQGGMVLVAIGEDHRVLALLHVTAHYSIGSPPLAEICGLLVDYSARGERIGTALLAAAEIWAHKKGLGEMLVNSNLVRDDALTFYCRSGYTHVREHLQFRKEIASGNLVAAVGLPEAAV
jgi:GNAT superfamily N-acetyltransferase